MKNIWGPVVIGGDNLPSPVQIGLTDLPNIGGASGPPGPPGSGITVYSLVNDHESPMSNVLCLKIESRLRDFKIYISASFC